MLIKGEKKGKKGKPVLDCTGVSQAVILLCFLLMSLVLVC